MIGQKNGQFWAKAAQQLKVDSISQVSWYANEQPTFKQSNLISNKINSSRFRSIDLTILHWFQSN